MSLDPSPSPTLTTSLSIPPWPQPTTGKTQALDLVMLAQDITSMLPPTPYFDYSLSYTFVITSKYRQFHIWRGERLYSSGPDRLKLPGFWLIGSADLATLCCDAVWLTSQPYTQACLYSQHSRAYWGKQNYQCNILYKLPQLWLLLYSLTQT